MAIKIEVTHCPSCQGRGVVVKGDQAERCGLCDGGRAVHQANLGAYKNAFDWAMKCGLSTGGGSRMGKLLLSLYNTEDFPVSAGECLAGMDFKGQELALRAIAAYAEIGENEELRAVGRELFAAMGPFAELCQAAVKAQYELKRRWEQERERES